MKKISLKKWSFAFAVVVCLLLASCIDGYHDDWTFSSGVTNKTLESPADSTIQILKNADGSKLLVSWPVVSGAKGYQVSVFNVDDPAHPVPVVDDPKKTVPIAYDSLFVDGCTFSCAYLKNTKYKIEIKALGNPKFSNKDADSATVVQFSTLLPAHAIIPDGTDLYTYFQSNAIPDSTKEVAYELMPYPATYTLSGPLDFQKHWIVLRGDKIHPPTITYTAAGRLMTTSGITIEYLNFDCSAITSTTSDGAFFSFSSTPDESLKGINSFYLVKSPKSVLISSCNFIKPLTTRFIYDNSKKYCIENLTVDNCIIPLGIIPTDGIIFFKAGYANNLYFTNNTLYGTASTAGYFLKYENSARPDRAGFVSASINLNNNTFYNVVNTGQMANYPAMSSVTVALTLSRNIFVNCGSGQVVRRLCVSSTNMVKTFNDNLYLFNGDAATTNTNEFVPTYGDKSGTGYSIDPLFKDPANGDFTIGAGATDVFTHASGDPRWLQLTQ
ncbi:MAG: DUF4992 family lipoprotein [Paludibacter sp.]|nr:DUF4992 family lipoprotein [Paludibacter sp.]